MSHHNDGGLVHHYFELGEFFSPDGLMKLLLRLLAILLNLGSLIDKVLVPVLIPSFLVHLQVLVSLEQTIQVHL